MQWFPLSPEWQKFEQNSALKSDFKGRVKVAIHLALHGKTHDLACLEKDLQKESIQPVVRRNEEGMVYGMTYIDYKNKVVFNGSGRDKEYSAKGVIARLAQRIVKEQETPVIQRSTRITSLPKEQKEDLNLAGEREKSNGLETTKMNDFWTVNKRRDQKGRCCATVWIFVFVFISY